MRSNYHSTDEEVSREHIESKLKSLSATLNDLKKGINETDDSPRFNTNTSALSQSSEIPHHRINYPNYSSKIDSSRDFSQDFSDLKAKSTIELIYIIQKDKQDKQDYIKTIESLKNENSIVVKRVNELNNVIAEMESNKYKESNDQINSLFQKLNYTEDQLGNCLNQLNLMEDERKAFKQNMIRLEDTIRIKDIELANLSKSIPTNEERKNVNQEFESLKKSYTVLLKEVENKTQLIQELKQNEIDNNSYSEEMQNEINNLKFNIRKMNERMQIKDEEIKHYKNIVLELNSGRNSVISNENIKVENFEVSHLKSEISEKNHLIQKLSDEIYSLKISKKGGASSTGTKTSRDTTDRKKKFNNFKANTERAQKSDKPESVSITRELIKKDKMKAESKQKSAEVDPEASRMLLEALCRICKSSIASEIIEYVEKLQNDNGLYNEYSKFYIKVKELIYSCVPYEYANKDDGTVRSLFKLVVKIVDNYAQMKNQIVILKEQVKLTENLSSNDADLANHFSTLLDANNRTNKSIIEEMRTYLNYDKEIHTINK